MVDVVTLLRKIFVDQFYRDNAAFFLLVIVLCFGFLSGKEHQALAEGFVGSKLTLLIPIGIWFFYLVKLMRYNFQSAGKTENLSVRNLTLLSFRSRFAALMIVSVVQFLPAIAYGTFVAVMAVKSGLPTRASEVVAALTAFTIVGTIALNFFISSGSSERKITVIERLFNFRFTRSFPVFCVEALIRKDPILLISTKIFSCVLIVAVSFLYERDYYDWRLLALGIAVAFSGNQVVVNTYHKMVNHDLMWVRNLPLSRWRRIGYSAIVLFLLSVPELVTIARNFPLILDFKDFIALTLFGFSIELLFYSLSYNPFAGTKVDRYFYGAMIGWLFAILFSVPLPAMIVINFALALLFHRSGFYKFEYGQKFNDQDLN
jgi:hypothetical protein